jgi:flagellar motor component MotA
MNTRVVVAGIAMVVLALAFFIGMATIASKSNDPVALMQTVGTVSGVIGTLGMLMAIIGALGNRNRRRLRS